MAPTTAERTRAIIALHLGVVIASDDAHLFDDLAADSLDAIELVMALEEEFGVEIPDDDAAALTTVAEAIALIERLVA